MSTPETEQKGMIKQWLSLRGFFNFPILQGLGAHRGIPDIIAAKKGKVFAIEVKAKGKSGRMGGQSDHQKNFQRQWTEAGCMYICGDLDAVIAALYDL